MDGITILNSFEVVTKTAFSITAFWAGVIIGSVVGLIAGVIFGLSESDWGAFFFSTIFFVLFIGLFIGLLSGFVICPEEVAKETHYEVLISENVSMSEFMQRYEIVDTRGQIYVVKEK